MRGSLTSPSGRCISNSLLGEELADDTSSTPEESTDLENVLAPIPPVPNAGGRSRSQKKQAFRGRICLRKGFLVTIVVAVAVK